MGSGNFIYLEGEPIYTHAIPSRVAEVNRKGSVLSYREGEWTILKNYSELLSRIRHLSRDKVTSENEPMRIRKNIFEQRISLEARDIQFEPTSDYLEICRSQKFSLSRVVSDATDSRLKERTAVLYLHSFHDAQFLYGDDGLGDNFNWTTWTIDRLRDAGFDWILLKVHPFAQYSTRFFSGRSADFFGLKALLRRYGPEPRVLIGSPGLTVENLAGSGSTVVVTRTGNVAPEFAYLGRPVVASHTARWCSNFELSVTWSDLADYEEILRSFSLGAIDGGMGEALHLQTEALEFLNNSMREERQLPIFQELKRSFGPKLGFGSSHANLTLALRSLSFGSR